MQSDNTPAEGVTDPILPKPTSSAAPRALLSASTIDDDFKNSFTISRPRSKTIDDAREEAEELMKDIRALAAQNGWAASRIKTREGRRHKNRNKKESGIPAPVKQTSPRKAAPKYKSVLEPTASVPRKMIPVDIGPVQQPSAGFDSLENGELNISRRFLNKDMLRDSATNMPHGNYTKLGPTTPISRRSRNVPSLFKDTPTFTVTPPTPNTSPLRRKSPPASPSKTPHSLDKETNVSGSANRLKPPSRRNPEDDEELRKVEITQQNMVCRAKNIPANEEQDSNGEPALSDPEKAFAIKTDDSLSKVLLALKIRNKGLDRVDQKVLDAYLSRKDTENQPASSDLKINTTQATKKQNAENHLSFGTPPETTTSMEADMDRIRASIRHSLGLDAFRRSQIPNNGFLASQPESLGHKLASQTQGFVPAASKEAASPVTSPHYQIYAMKKTEKSMRFGRQGFSNYDKQDPLSRKSSSVQQIHNSTKYHSPIWPKPDESPTSRLESRGAHKSLPHSELRKLEPISLGGIGIPTPLSRFSAGNESVKFMDAYDIAQQVKELHAQDKHVHPPVALHDLPQPQTTTMPGSLSKDCAARPSHTLTTAPSASPYRTSPTPHYMWPTRTSVVSNATEALSGGVSDEVLTRNAAVITRIKREEPVEALTPSKEIQSSLDKAINWQIDQYKREGRDVTPSGQRVRDLLEWKRINQER